MTDGGVGGNVGDSSSRFYYFEERGNPDGFIAIADSAFGADEFFVAPQKFSSTCSRSTTDASSSTSPGSPA
ncbi:MAG: hypothetical protein R2748_04490 [Bryobacterales bacterium]